MEEGREKGERKIERGWKRKKIEKQIIIIKDFRINLKFKINNKPKILLISAIFNINSYFYLKCPIHADFLAPKLVYRKCFLYFFFTYCLSFTILLNY